MGREANCTAHFEKQTGNGKLQHETDDLIFRGDFRLKIPLKEIKKAVAKNGDLTVEWKSGGARFTLGADAEKWAHAINNPKSLLDKLGVKPEHRVSAIGITDDGFLADLERRVGSIVTGKAQTGSDLIFFQADEPAALAALSKLAQSIAPDGAVWVVTPKKRPEIADTVVMAAGKQAGLVDVKVARFSDAYTTLKFVIPKAKR